MPATRMPSPVDPSAGRVADVLSELPPPLCADCIGRAFAHAEPGPTNVDRGRRRRPDALDPGDGCPLCEGISGRFERYADVCVSAARDYEFATFLVGSVLFPEIRRREDDLYERLAARAPELRHPPREGEAAAPAFRWAEYLKAEVNREVGKRLEARLGRRVDFQRPEVVFQVDTRFDHVQLQVASSYVRGRYRKFDRGLPQTRWPCRACGGLGCRRCGKTGRTYATSVEELVAAPFLEASGAAGEAFHGMGREDIDARMLGNGRPFVLELKGPRRRALDWSYLAAAAGQASGDRVEVLDVAPTGPETLRRYKEADPDKTYRARCVVAGSVDVGKLISLLPSFAGVLLDQRTPERVAHRRADRVRRRRIHEVRLVGDGGDRLELEIRAQSGTYIKEFVSGDGGRTRPSLSEALGVPCRVEELDVVDVAWKE